LPVRCGAVQGDRSVTCHRGHATRRFGRGCSSVCITTSFRRVQFRRFAASISSLRGLHKTVVPSLPELAFLPMSKATPAVAAAHWFPNSRPPQPRGSPSDQFLGTCSRSDEASESRSGLGPYPSSGAFGHSTTHPQMRSASHSGSDPNDPIPLAGSGQSAQTTLGSQATPLATRSSLDEPGHQQGGPRAALFGRTATRPDMARDADDTRSRFTRSNRTQPLGPLDSVWTSSQAATRPTLFEGKERLRPGPNLREVTRRGVARANPPRGLPGQGTAIGFCQTWRCDDRARW
jgi:hypothetical protein